MFWDPTMILLIPVLIFAAWAQSKVSSTFRQFSKVRTMSGFTGYQAARNVLDANGLSDIQIERVKGSLTDHYDPRTRTLRLSEGVYSAPSLAAVGVAAHEAGHALQHAHGYTPLAFRSFIFPVAQFGSFAAWPLFFIGFLFVIPSFMTLGIIVFTFAALFQFATLPVELDASRRAIAALEGNGIVSANEVDGARKVLNAAALTYVAAVLMSVMQLIRLLVLRNSRD
jgi:Zn-dependent membrane protease YugP